MEYTEITEQYIFYYFAYSGLFILWFFIVFYLFLKGFSWLTWFLRNWRIKKLFQ